MDMPYAYLGRPYSRTRVGSKLSQTPGCLFGARVAVRFIGAVAQTLVPIRISGTPQWRMDLTPGIGVLIVEIDACRYSR